MPVFYITETADKSDIDKNFKAKHGKKFKFIDIKSNFDSIKRYIKSDSTLSKNINDIKNGNIIGEIAIDENSGDLAGYIIVIKDSGMIEQLYVYKEYRGYGLSNSLLKDGIDKYNAKQLNVYYDNLIAINLYKKFGFKETFRKIYGNGNGYIHMERT